MMKNSDFVLLKGKLLMETLSFEEALEADSKNHEARFYLGRIALQEDDLDAAIDHLEQALRFSSGD